MKNLKNIKIDNFISFNETNFNLNLTYEVFGQPFGEAPIVMINHALTGNSTLAGDNGWWKNVVGYKKLIDTERFSILAFNFPGNGFGGKLIDNYKDLILSDIAKIFLIGLKKLNIQSLFAIIGGSIGGSLIWEIAAISPNIAQNLIPIACDWRSSDWVIANSRLQHQILTNSSNPIHDARIHAMLCYRSPKSFEKKFNRSLNEDLKIFNIESWLLYHGNKLKKRFQLSSYKLMNHLLSTINITRNTNKEFEDIASNIMGNIYIVSVDSDLLFTDSQNRDTFYRLCKVKDNIFFKTIKSIHGHDAFLIEHNQLKLLLNKIFIQDSSSSERNLDKNSNLASYTTKN